MINTAVQQANVSLDNQTTNPHSDVAAAVVFCFGAALAQSSWQSAQPALFQPALFQPLLLPVEITGCQTPEAAGCRPWALAGTRP